MKLSSTLDVSVVAHETADELAVLLDLEAPATAEADAARAPSTLQIVLDRSGSMRGAPLEGAKQALVALVQRLDPTDNFGVVTFDDEAQVVVPVGQLTDKAAVIARIQAIGTGGMTNLSAGYLRGLRELKRAKPAGARGTLLLISDGHVNGGVTDHDDFASLARKAYDDGVVTSTLGYGDGYDESLLSVISRSGSGNHVFAVDPDTAGAAIAKEVDGLLDKVVQAASITVRFEPAVRMLRLYNDLPAQQVGDGAVMIELGDLYASEPRKLLMKFQVPAMAALGLAQIATIELQYVEVPGLVEHTVNVPISVNVVPGDEATERVPDPIVQTEVLFQEAQHSKRLASEAFERGEDESGRTLLGASIAGLESACLLAPPAVAPDISAELDEVRGFSAMSRDIDASIVSKRTRESYHRQNRKRGRSAG